VGRGGGGRKNFRERLEEAKGEVRSKETAVRAMGVRKVRGMVKELVEEGKKRRGRAAITVVGEEGGEVDKGDVMEFKGAITKVRRRGWSEASAGMSASYVCEGDTLLSLCSSSNFTMSNGPSSRFRFPAGAPATNGGLRILRLPSRITGNGGHR